MIDILCDKEKFVKTHSIVNQFCDLNINFKKNMLIFIQYLFVLRKLLNNFLSDFYLLECVANYSKNRDSVLFGWSFY